MTRPTVRPLGPPAIALPFPPVDSAPAPWLGPRLARWLDQMGHAVDRRMTDRYIAARIDQLVATVYPTALPDRLELIAQLIVWMFVYDDHFDVGRLGRDPVRAESAAQQVNTVVRDEDPASRGPLLASLAVFARRFQEADARLWRRISSDLVLFVNSVATEVNPRVQGVEPSPAEYDDLRLKTFAWDVLVDLVEFAHRAEVPEGVRSTAEYKGLVHTAGLVMCGINDLFSVGKELDGQETHNLVLVLMRTTGYGLHESIAISEALINRRVETFLAYSDTWPRMYHRLGLTPSDRAVGNAFVTGLKSLMRGQFDWCRSTSRYQSGTGYASGLTGGYDDLLNPR